jgi:hypothetical protein
MNKQECDLLTNSVWDCSNCEDYKQCQYSRIGWHNLLLPIVFIVCTIIVLWKVL